MRKIGLCVTGSFCTFASLLKVVDRLIEADYDVTPIFSYNVSTLDTRFFKQSDFEDIIVQKTGKYPVKNIVEAEALTKSGIELMLVAPCTGNTLAKIAHGIWRSKPRCAQTSPSCCQYRQTTHSAQTQQISERCSTPKIYISYRSVKTPQTKNRTR